MFSELDAVLQKLDILVGQAEELSITANEVLKTSKSIEIEASMIKSELQNITSKYTDDLK